MRKNTLFLALAFLCLTSTAQISETKRQKQLFLGSTNLILSSPSVTLKKQLKKENRFFNIGLSDVSLNFESSEPRSSTDISINEMNASAAILLGLEFRKPINDDFTFFHGPGIRPRYTLEALRREDPLVPLNQRTTYRHTYGISIPYTLGLMYQIKDKFGVSVDWSPSLYAEHLRSDATGNKTSVGLSYFERSGRVSFYLNL